MHSLLRQHHLVIIVTFVAVLGFLVFLFTSNKAVAPEEVPVDTTTLEISASEDTAVTSRVIGASVMGRDISSYTYGNRDGDVHLLFVGGIHGGYEWNSTLLSYELMDYLEANPASIPSNIMVTIIPSVNPDGLYAVLDTAERFTLADVPTTVFPLGTGRFNANQVDLNRNFDCKWKPQSTWRGNIVNAGTSAFSEPEAAAIRDFVLETSPTAVLFYHSQSNAVYASECTEGILPETRTLMNTYAQAAGYPAVDMFDAYEITGDAEGWLASIGIPAVTVELSTHKTIEWEKNLRGVQALFKQYGN